MYHSAALLLFRYRKRLKFKPCDDNNASRHGGNNVSNGHVQVGEHGHYDRLNHHHNMTTTSTASYESLS